MNGASLVALRRARALAKAVLACGVPAMMAGATALAQPQVAAVEGTATLTLPLPEVLPEIYRTNGARHLYAQYGERIFKGPLPPLLYAIAIIETEIDEDGNVVEVRVTREPASAKDVIPWIVGLIKAASPFPKPQAPGRTRYEDIWLVDRTYTFQLHTLTEGQR